MLITSTYSNLAFSAPLNPIGQASSGELDLSNQLNSIKPVEEIKPVSRPQVQNHRSTSYVQKTSPGQEEDDKSRAEEAGEKRKMQEDQREVERLSARDREVRAHEQAHAAIGGQYAGAPTYQFERGPDGVNYAVAGEVAIDVGKGSTPAQTLSKMQIVRRAALAPEEPSEQDRRVAAQATRLEVEARQDLARETSENAEGEDGETKNNGADHREGRTESLNSDSVTTLSSSAGSEAKKPDKIANQSHISSQLFQGIANSGLNRHRAGSLVNTLA